MFKSALVQLMTSSTTNRGLLGEDAKNLPISDEEVVQRIRAGETSLFEVVMRRYNQRLYRVARAILRDDAEAEDVTQQAYVNAYRHLNQFASRAMFSTWLTKIAVHEALDVPVEYLGVGEASDDLVQFDASEFARELLGEE